MCFTYRKKYFTLNSHTTSPMGWHLCLLCILASRHTKHTGSWSSMQNSLSFSPCRLHSSTEPSEASAPGYLSFERVSQRFFKMRLVTSSFSVDIFLQIGHCLHPFVSQYCSRQALQKLWVQVRMTGLLKISQQTGQLRSSISQLVLRPWFIQDISDILGCPKIVCLTSNKINQPSDWICQEKQQFSFTLYLI